MKIKSDIKMVTSNECLIYIIHPRVLPVSLFRLSNWLTNNRLGIFGKILAILNQILFGCDIARRADIDGGFYLPHPSGVVIGENVKLGKNCVIHQGVTLGARGEDHESELIVEDYVEIGTGAKILGNITLGKYSRIGANSVVLKDIPSKSVVVGIPGVVIKLRTDI